jgi:hypothetical protein
MPEQVTVTGRLVRDVVAPGSKSEAGALVLASGTGNMYLVRRRGAPSWGDDDPELAVLEGRAVELTGSVIAGTLLVDEWRVLD